MSIIFAGKEFASYLNYLEKQGKELGVSLKIPEVLKPLIKLYIGLFGIPDLGFQERFYLFQKSISELKGKVFIDAGCGNGVYSRFMASRFPRSEIYSLDINKKIIELNKKMTTNPNIHFFYADVMKKVPKLKNKADALWCLDVLEHIPNYRAAIQNMNQMIKKGGYLFIHVPTPHQRRWFKSFETWEHEDHAHDGISEKELLSLLENYEIMRKKGTFGSVGSLLWETNILLFKRAPFIAAILYPLLRILFYLDEIIPSKKYNCIGILAKKIT
ncbi:class I SAM-dependent methyltransferase [Candidatus Roizmanbacteria bacterium]|nr:class I SAM-dependent methyltransferase [Candidatus Roizmanbacteria bacterium]